MHTLVATSPQLTSSAIAYPPALIELLQARFGMKPGQSGVVISRESTRLAELFQRHGAAVTVVTATPEQLDLPTASVDFLAADRILFLPDQERIRGEFQRVLKPGAPVVLVTDNRVYAGGQQQEAYESLLRAHCQAFREKRLPYDIAGAVATFFREGRVFEDAFIGQQPFTLAEFLAQAESLSIYPPPGNRHRAILESALHQFFERWADPETDVLKIPTVCRIACGTLG